MSSRGKKLCELASIKCRENDEEDENDARSRGNQVEDTSVPVMQAEVISPKNYSPAELLSEVAYNEDHMVDSEHESIESEPEDPFAGTHSDTDPEYEPSISSPGSSLDSDDSIDNIDLQQVIVPEDEQLCEADLEANEVLEDLQNDIWTPMDNGNVLNIVEYAEKQKINVDFKFCKIPLDVFKLFVDHEVIDLIVQETNKYAWQKINSGGIKNKSRLKGWSDTNVEEIYCFFGIVICMGLVRVPAVSLYWSKNDLYHNNYICRKMTRDRFLLLLQHIHFNDNENLEASQDHLFRIRPILDLLNSRFQSVLTPGKEVVIDESMIPWRGRLGIRQYIKNKRHKYGVKLYKLCTVEGYTLNIRIYCGKETTQNADPNDPHTVKVVMDLMQNVVGSGRSLYADNFYSSVALVKKLQQQKTLYCGTLRSNKRGLPKDFVNRKIKKNQVIGVHNGHGVKIIKWMDKRPILMISNKREHDITLHDTGRKTRSSEVVLKPKCITDYNKAKKGVDISDQMSSYYTALRKGLKWYRKIGFELIFGSAIVNSHIVYNEVNQTSRLNMLQFRQQLAFSLTETKTENNASTIQAPKRIHTLETETGLGKKRRRNCVGCYQKLRATLSSREADKKVQKVTTYCADCAKKPAMCLSCFNEKHSNLPRV
nr:unnamed protein product [Callosobruchus chinensis]